MTLSPDLALAYLEQLSADYRAGVVLDADGAMLAGDERLAAAARTLPAGTHAGATEAGKVFAVRTPTHALAVTTGPFALPGLTLHDLRTTLAALGAESAQETPIQTIPHSSVTALVDATNLPFRPHSAL